jgi:hypothetical protein
MVTGIFCHFIISRWNMRQETCYMKRNSTCRYNMHHFACNIVPGATCETPHTTLRQVDNRLPQNLQQTK